LLLTRHTINNEQIYSGIVVTSQSAFDALFAGGESQTILTTTATTPASALPEGDAATNKEIDDRPIYENLTEAEFIALAKEHNVSTTHLELAIRVFNGLGYPLEGDLVWLLHLPISELITLYQNLLQ
jgi:hypothetical protein